MRIVLDQIVYFQVTTHDPATGAEINADSAPTFSVYEDATGTAMAGLSAVAMTNVTTGQYRGTYTASAANGFAIGKCYTVVARGTVGGVSGKTIAQSYVLESAAAAGVNVIQIAGSAAAAQNLRDSATTIYVGTVASGSTATVINDAGLTQPAANHWVGRIVIFLTGSLQYQGTRITASVAGALTVSPLTAAPTAGDMYVVL